MKYKAIFYMQAKLLLMVGGFLLVPAFVSWLYHEQESLHYFLYTAGAVLLLGLILFAALRRHKDEPLGLRDGFLLVTLSWLLLSVAGAVPFYVSGFFPTFTDAFFESVSGFTTTGASVLTHIEALPHGLLFWRDFAHWIGGMGIIVLAVAILPQLSVGGMQLMRSEMPGPTFEQLKPRIKQTALSLWKIYLLFSVMEVLALYLLGMPLFDSICHMFGTMGTGGFSTKNASIAYYHSPAIQYTIAFFMFIAGANFVLHYAALQGNLKKVFQDGEWRFYVRLVVISVLLIGTDLVIQNRQAIADAFRLSLFQVLSIVTTTGYVTADFDAWPHFSKGLLFLLMFVGGCAGSTGGGLKQVRLMLLFKMTKQAIVQHIFPKAVVTVKLNGRPVPPHVLRGISGFLLLYLMIFSVCSLILLAFQIDFITATSAVAATLGNVGPGFGLVGASQNYAFLPAAVKLVLSACMLIGRLEIFTILVLFFPATWRR